MGTWGVKTFENDTAQDWLSELEDEKDLTIVIVKLFELLNAYNNQEDTIDSDLSSEVLAAAEIVSALFGSPSRELPTSIINWIEKKKTYERSLVSTFNKIIKITEFDDDFKIEWKKYTKEQKWDFILNALSEYATNLIDYILEKSELKELWQSSDEYEKWVQEVNDLKMRCERAGK